MQATSLKPGVGSWPSVVEGRLENGELRIRVFGASRPELRAQVTALLGVDTPPLAVQGHPVLERLSRHHRGIHLGHTLQLGHDLIKTVMQQLIEWRVRRAYGANGFCERAHPSGDAWVGRTAHVS